MKSMTKFFVTEIFCSINGEGTLTGELAVFIRLSGCNLRCSFCDTTYAWQFTNGNNLTIDEILAKVRTYQGVKNITLTGGEPLYRANIDQLLSALANDGYLINIETNGSVLLEPFLGHDYSDKLIFCCDYKLPSSNEEQKMQLKNLALLREQDVLKFVAGTNEDFAKAFEIIAQNNIKSYIYLSPIYGKLNPQVLVETLKSWASEVDTSKCRVQLQLHKYIWDPMQTGV